MVRYKWLVVLISFILVGYNGVAFAADHVGEMAAGLGGFGGAFQGQVGNLTRGLMAASKLIVIVLTATAACMIAFGIQDANKTLWNWILGVGLALNFADLITTFWSVQSGGGGTKLPDYNLVLKNEKTPEIDILAPFMQYYIGVIRSGAAAVVPYAVNLTLILATIEGTFKIAFDLISGDKIKYIVIMIVKVGIFIFLIQNWVGTNSGYQLMPMLGSGFESIGYTAGGASDMVKSYNAANPDSNIEVQSGQIVTNALNFWNIFWEKIDGKNILTCLVGFICAVAAVVILFLTALEMFMARIEFWTMALITLVLLPFGVLGQLKFLADKAIGAMFNLAIKLFVIAFIATMSVNILTGLVKDAQTVGASADFAGNISYLLQVLLYALILFLLTKKIPALVSGLLSGNPSLGGGDMKQMAMQAAQTAAQVGAAVASGGASAAGGLAKGIGAAKAFGDNAKALGFGGAAKMAGIGLGSKAMSGMMKSAESFRQNNPYNRGQTAMNDLIQSGFLTAQANRKPQQLNEGQAALPAPSSSSSQSSGGGSQAETPSKPNAPSGGSGQSAAKGSAPSQSAPELKKFSAQTGKPAGKESQKANQPGKQGGNSAPAKADKPQTQSTAASTDNAYYPPPPSDDYFSPPPDDYYAPPPDDSYYSPPPDDYYDVSPSSATTQSAGQSGQRITTPKNNQQGSQGGNSGKNNNAPKQNSGKINNNTPPNDNEIPPPRYD